MAQLPYVTSPGNIDKALNGIKSAAVPDRVSLDFVKTILKIPGGSGDQMTSYLKKIGFVNPDGTPSDAYKKFRNPSLSGEAVASVIKIGYAPLYVRNEYMHELNDSALIGLITEETGQPHDSNTVKLTFTCIKHLKFFADFKKKDVALDLPQRETDVQPLTPPPASAGRQQGTIGLNLGYTINLNLPATSDPEVFDAIFKSLKSHLLSSDDA
ncbi:DUF5343 domain-containing protein [Bosea sp. BH3]|uniref:DUF5343 domain-containing protein n=1 Tax=Bosea sp. BH3 TaxID=2871701 RepID=UPI0021CB71D2|nr:DUF5343 domain-containing protein [Bosea sp. BH3]MCU4178091.1 DUF5343 domain-containing protein [Bosea sp. BH3]